MFEAIETIKTEHGNLDRVLKALEESVAGLAAAETKPDLDLLYSTLYYIRMFPLCVDVELRCFLQDFETTG